MLNSLQMKKKNKLCSPSTLTLSQTIPNRTVKTVLVYYLLSEPSRQSKPRGSAHPPSPSLKEEDTIDKQMICSG